MAGRLVITLVKEKETANTIRFQEEAPDDAEPKIGTVYVRKLAAKELGDPTRIKLTVEAVG